MEYVFALMFVVIGAAVFMQGFKVQRQHRLIKDIPQSKIRSMAMGLVEIHGSVEADQQMKSPFSATDCVFYRYEIKELQKRSTTSGGKRRTTKEWVTIAQGDKRLPFRAVDDTGSAAVDPSGADFNLEIKHSYHQDRGVFDGMSGLIDRLKNLDGRNEKLLDVSGLNLKPIEPGKLKMFSNTVGDRRYYESLLCHGDPLFLMGTAANTPETPDHVVLKKGDNEPTFMISDKSEKDMLRSLRNKMITAFALGGITFIAGVLVTLHLSGVI